MKKYESMVYLTRPVSTRKAMSKGNRAAQFAPFAALSGHDVAIQRATMKKEERIELSEDQKRTLNEKIVECKLKAPLWVESLVYYSTAEPYPLGAYCQISGEIVRVDEINHCLILKEGLRIPFSDLLELNIP